MSRSSEQPFRQPSQSVDILILAGEHSGDAHAATLINDLRERNPALYIAAIGGPALQRRADLFLFDLVAHSVVGLIEVLKHYRFFKETFDRIVSWVRDYQPKIILLVDNPGLNLRLASAFRKAGISRKGGGSCRVLHYISPQIWAWKAHRRFSMARDLDALAAIFPFEPEIYADTDLPVRFVGHPFAREDYVSPIHYATEAPILLTPGSRRQPVRRIFPRMLDGFQLFAEANPSAQAIVPYPDETIRGELEYLMPASLSERLSLRPASEQIEASAVLASSGTMSLQCALAGLPGAIIYVAHPLTFRIGQRVVKIPYLGMANLLLRDRPPYPELIQNQATPASIAKAISDATTHPQQPALARQAASDLHRILAAPKESSPAQWVESFL